VALTAPADHDRPTVHPSSGDRNRSGKHRIVSVDEADLEIVTRRRRLPLVDGTN
jgi:hypothetical protein